MELKLLAILGIVICSEAMGLCLIFPFIYFMVKDFGIAEKNIGTHVGIIASSFSLAQFSALLWGWLSDRIGRRKILLFGLIGNVVTFTLFGLSTSFPMAVVTRAMTGLVNGNIAVAKSVLGDVTTDADRSSAFSIISFIFSFGMIAGPLVGGLLSNPAQNIDLFRNSQFLLKYPYFLPCMLPVLLSLVGFLVGWQYLPETAFLKEKSRDLDDSRPTSGIGFYAIGASIAYGLLAFQNIVFTEVLSLWAIAPPNIGLGMSSPQIGIIYAIMGVFGLSTNAFLYPYVSKRLSALTMFRSFIFVYLPCFVILPLVSSYLAGNRVAVWSILSIDLGVKAMADAFTFTSVFILVLSTKFRLTIRPNRDNLAR
jgi:MFS family permease